MAAKAQPIIVIKKKGGHGGGHNGGAWKVAYADFVTAMMALFIVLWLMGSSEKVKKAVAGYFNDPKGTASLLGTTMAGNGDVVTRADENQKRLQELKEKLEEEIKAKKELEKLIKQIEMTITPEGLRIELHRRQERDVLPERQRAAQPERAGTPRAARRRTQNPAQPTADRGSHRRRAILHRHKLQQLGALGRPRQLCAPIAAATRRARRSGDAGARLRRPIPAREKQSLRSLQPPHHDSGEESGWRVAAAARPRERGGWRAGRRKSQRLEAVNRDQL